MTTPPLPPPGLELRSRPDGLWVFADAQGNAVQRAFPSAYASGVTAPLDPAQIFVGWHNGAFQFANGRKELITTPVTGEVLDGAGNVVARATMIAPTTSTLLMSTSDGTWRLYDQASTSLPFFSGYVVLPSEGGSIGFGVSHSLPNGYGVNEWFPGSAVSASGFSAPAPLIGTTLADTVVGADAADAISTRRGADLVLAGAGSDYVNGGDGDDIIFGSNAGALAAPGDDDFLFGGEGDDILVGELGADVLFGNQGKDVLIGGTFVEGATGRFDDTMYGGAGDDILIGGLTSNGHFHGGAGDDVVYVGGGIANNVILDGAGNDVVFLGPRDGFGSSDRILVDANAIAAGGRLTVYDLGVLGVDAVVLPSFVRGSVSFLQHEQGVLMSAPGYNGTVWELFAVGATVARMQNLVGYVDVVEVFLPPFRIPPDAFPGGIRYDDPSF
jgi:Ca2+-binding RTX toxin-like protein